MSRLLRRPVRRLLASLRSVKFNMRGLFKTAALVLQSSSQSSRQKRLLVIWDFAAQPYSVGDILVFHELSLLLCHQLNLANVEFCLLADPDEPSRHSFRKLNVNSVNYIEYVSALIPVFLISDRVTGLHYFSSPRDLEKFVLNHADEYHVWPDLYTYATGKELNRESLFKITEFYKQHDFLPTLTFRPALVDWGRRFISQVCKSRIAVAVQLRNAGKYNSFRNSNLDAWIEFFGWCDGRFPVEFIVVCSREELDDRLRTLKNVIIAKDYDTTLDQDLALIYSAPAFMGGSSGPAIVAFFRDKPYSIVNSLHGEYMPCLVEHDWGCRWLFSRDHQRLIGLGQETVQMLIDEFQILYGALAGCPVEQNQGEYTADENNLRIRAPVDSRYYC